MRNGIAVAVLLFAAPLAAAAQAQQSPVEDREGLYNRQVGAPRPDAKAIDPEMLGFIPIPETKVLLRINAKPRVDFTMDNRNSGNENRFVTSDIPVSSDPAHGGGSRFNINAKGSQLSLDVRAPEIEGSPRFFFLNDFYGDGDGEFPLRVDQLYGEIYNIIVGMTFSVFEDPDAWPDTVDYEGPNAAVFARRPLARLMLPVNDEWHFNVGIEQPESEIDAIIDPVGEAINHWPDLGANVRWESEDYGHVQAAVILRQLGFEGPVTGNQRAFGWGFNVAGSIEVFGDDSAQFQFTVGEGIFRYLCDNFESNDAAFDEDGDLTPIPVLALMFGYTHYWNEEWRSTATYGYVTVDNQESQDPTAYHQTHYASANVVWQIRKRLSLGLEGLYGSKEQEDGDRGNVFRINFGLVYSLFE